MKKNTILVFALTVLTILSVNAALVMNTNQASINAQKNLSKTQAALQKSFERLSSEYRINSASDDAAGLGLSEKMKESMEEMENASRTVADTINLLQTAGDALADTTSVLNRIRSLGLRAGTGRQGVRAAREYENILAEIDRINQNMEDETTPGMEEANQRISEILEEAKDAIDITSPERMTEKSRKEKLEELIEETAKEADKLAERAAKTDEEVQKALLKAYIPVKANEDKPENQQEEKTGRGVRRGN